jgi:hypothetical protein
VRERPSFEDITLYQLCYWKVTRIYGLTPEEIEDLLTNPDPQTPSHHQVDPRIIKAYLTGESVPTYLPREVPSHYYSGFLPAYLPRDRFKPSERVVPLVDHQYRLDYHTWKNCLDANTRATKSLVEHLTDPSYQVIEASLSLPEPILFLLSELQNSGGGMDISSHITASTTSYYLEVTTETLLTTT